MNNEEKILSLLETLVVKVDNLEQRFDSLEQRVGSLEQKTDSIHETVARVELEHGQKLDALFDGYSLLHDITGEVRSDIAALKRVQDKQDLHLKWMEVNKRKTV